MYLDPNISSQQCNENPSWWVIVNESMRVTWNILSCTNLYFVWICNTCCHCIDFVSSAPCKNIVLRLVLMHQYCSCSKKWTLFSKDQNKKRVFLATVCTTPFLSQQYVAHQVEFNKGQDPWNIHFSITRDVLLMHFCCCSVAAVCTVLWSEQCIPLYAMNRSMELILRC